MYNTHYRCIILPNHIISKYKLLLIIYLILINIYFIIVISNSYKIMIKNNLFYYLTLSISLY